MAIFLLWYPVLVPQIEGGSEPVCPVAAKVSSQAPAGEVVANPENVWKSSLN